MFSTKRLGLLFAALLVGTMSLGIITSGAWFTDSDTVAVTATSGEIEIQSNELEPFTVTNLLPGVWTDNFDMNVYNTAESTTAVKYRITAAATGGSSDLYNAILVRVKHTHCTGADRGTWPVVFEGPVSTFSVNSIDHAISDSLGINITHCYGFEFSLPTTAGNAYQELSATFNLVTDATQPENPGWSE
jgi:hypothetical protein